MTIAGIIAEYNPLHNGHMWHMSETRRRAAADYVVCVMGGAFSQRGEPMLLDKFARAEMALLSGADAVFELPALFALRPADAFAFGGAAVLHALKADCLSFGCEIDDMALLTRAAGLLREEPPEMAQAIQAGLDNGMSHARARGAALSRAMGVAQEALNKPNFILALEYLNALHTLGGDIQPLLVPRAGDYHASDALGRFPSATAVRRALADGRLDEALAAVPEPARARMALEIPDGLADAARLDNLYLHVLRGMSPEAIDALPDAGEGLGMRVSRMARACGSRAALIQAVKCKRYTFSRVSRLLSYALTGLSRDLIAQNPLPYARLLGFRKDARPLLTELARRAGDALITDGAKLIGNPAFEYERRVTDLWGLAALRPEYRAAGRERTEKFLLI